jgi:hypothetical protein
MTRLVNNKAKYLIGMVWAIGSLIYAKKLKRYRNIRWIRALRRTNAQAVSEHSLADQPVTRSYWLAIHQA